MAGEHEQNSEYHRSRQPGMTLDSRQDCSDSTQHSSTGMLLGLPGLMRCAGMGARCNAHVRVEGMQQMQQTHGNRAVQRALSTNGATRHIAVQRSPDGMKYELSPEVMQQVMQQMMQERAHDEPDTREVATPQAVQSPAPYMPPAPPMQDVSPSFWDRIGSGGDINTMVGDVNNVVDVGTSSLGWMGDVSMAGHIWPGISPVADLVTRSPGSSSLARSFANFTPGGKAMNMIGKGSDALGMAKGVFDFATAKDNYGRVQAGADTAFSAAGFFGGPLLGALSFGYSAGQLLDKTFGLSSKLSGVLQDWDPLGLNEPSMDELSGDQLREMRNSPIRAWEAQQEIRERRGFVGRSQNRIRAREDAQKQTDFEKEMAQYGARARGEYQRPSQEPDPLTIRAQAPKKDTSPATPSHLSAEDAALLQSVVGEQYGKDEEEAPLPAVSMRVP